MNQDNPESASTSGSKQSALPAREAVTAGFVIATILMILVPLPAILLDLLMSLQLALAVTILVISLRIRRIIEFSSFPTVLLLTTLLGLALNISSTRLILVQGSGFQGRLVRAFGSFVTGSSSANSAEGIIVGFLIFSIILAVQLSVITKGSGRIAEVAARFTLDALPGRQLAIDSEFNSGRITAREAKNRSMDLRREADFYGQMDGASRYISGNAKVGLFITGVNILGGFIVGMAIRGEDFSTALSTYTALTIGDGLVTQIPSLFISVAAGILVTRANSGENFARQAGSELAAQKGSLIAVAATLAIMAFLPGFPWYVLLPLAALSGYTGLAPDAGRKARFFRRFFSIPDTGPTESRQASGPAVPHTGTGQPSVPPASVAAPAATPDDAPVMTRTQAPDPDLPSSPPSGVPSRQHPASVPSLVAGEVLPEPGTSSAAIFPVGPARTRSGMLPEADMKELPIAPVLLEVGYGLVPLVLGEEGEEVESGFMRSLTALRLRVSARIRASIPPVRIVDDPGIAPYGYRLSFRGERVSSATLKPGRVLASLSGLHAAGLPEIGHAQNDVTGERDLCRLFKERTGIDAERLNGHSDLSLLDPPGLDTPESSSESCSVPAIGSGLPEACRLFWIPRGDSDRAQTSGCRILTHGDILLSILELKFLENSPSATPAESAPT